MRREPTERALLISLLPLLFRQSMAAGVSIQELLAFASRYGGRRIYIPKSARGSAAQRLREVFSQRGWEVFVGTHRGEEVEVPRAYAILRSVRNIELIGEIEDGSSAAEVAAVFGLTVRQVRNILAKHRAAASRATTSGGQL